MMTLDQAIQHAEEVAERCDLTNRVCSDDHRMLAAWL